MRVSSAEIARLQGARSSLSPFRSPRLGSPEGRGATLGAVASELAGRLGAAGGSDASPRPPSLAVHSPHAHPRADSPADAGPDASAGGESLVAQQELLNQLQLSARIAEQVCNHICNHICNRPDCQAGLRARRAARASGGGPEGTGRGRAGGIGAGRAPRQPQARGVCREPLGASALACHRQLGACHARAARGGQGVGAGPQPGRRAGGGADGFAAEAAACVSRSRVTYDLGEAC